MFTLDSNVLLFDKSLKCLRDLKLYLLKCCVKKDSPILIKKIANKKQ